MAMEPYTNQVAFDNAKARDAGLPQVDGVIDLRGAVDNVSKLFEPGIKKKREEEALADVQKDALAKDENGNFVRPKTRGFRGQVYQETFDKASGLLYRLDIQSRAEVAYGELMKQHPRDPDGLHNALKAYNDGVMATVDPDVMVEVQEVLNRESAQRLNLVSSRTQEEGHRNVIEGLGAQFSIRRKRQRELMKDDQLDPSTIANVVANNAELDRIKNELIALKDKDPSWFDAVALETALEVDAFQREQAVDIFARDKTPGLYGMTIAQRELFLQVSGEGARDYVAGEEPLKLSDGTVLTYQYLRQLRENNPAALNAIRARVQNDINDEEADLRVSEAATAAAEVETNRQLEIGLATTRAMTSGNFDSKQKEALDTQWLIKGGAIAPDGTPSVTPNEVMNDFLTPAKPGEVSQGMLELVSFAESFRYVPAQAERWMAESFTNGNHMAAINVINNLRDSVHTPTGAKIGEELYFKLPPKIRQMADIANTLVREGLEAKLPPILNGISQGVPFDGQAAWRTMKDAGRDGIKERNIIIAKNFPSLGKSIPNALIEDFNVAMNTLAGAGVPADRLVKAASEHVRRAWAPDKRFVGGAGPAEFVSRGYDDRAITAGVEYARRKAAEKGEPYYRLGPEYSFEKGTLAIAPMRYKDASEGFGLWGLYKRDHNGNTRFVSQFNMATADALIQNARDRIAPIRAAEAERAYRSDRAVRERAAVAGARRRNSRRDVGR